MKLHPHSTVLLLVFGLVLGGVAPHVGTVGDSVSQWSTIDPHLFLFIFLPPLIYVGTNSVDFYIFKSSIYQMLILAGPGLLLSMVLTAGFVKFGFDYDWDWSTCLAFGAMLSATDPVAVVSLLHELGITKQLTILIEGESLFNDGTAMVAFMICKSIMIEENETDMLSYSVTSFTRLAIGGPVLGYLAGVILVVLLGSIVDDPASEIVLTLVTCYGTFYLADYTPLHVSGVLAVVILGLYMSYVGKMSVSVTTEHFMHEFWELLGYVANTLIFVVSGVLIMTQAMSESSDIGPQDFSYLLILYLVLHIIRGISVACFSPILRSSGYGLTLHQSLILVWSGLRGAVGLALALMMESHAAIPSKTKALFIFHMAGIALLTLVINGTSTRALLKYLKMDRGSFASKKIFDTAVQQIDDRTEMAVQTLKEDMFYTDADWSIVWSYIPVLSNTTLRKRQARHSLNLQSQSTLRSIGRIESSFLTREDEHKNGSGKKPSNNRRNSVSSSEDNTLSSEIEPPASIRLDIQGFDDGPHSETSRASAHASLSNPISNVHDDSETDEPPQILERAEDLKGRFKLEARHRFFNLLKASYWHQFEIGFVGKQALRILMAALSKSEDASYHSGHHALQEPGSALSSGPGAEYHRVDEWKQIELICKIPIFMRRLYHVPVLGTLLHRSMFRFVSITFDVATSFLSAHRKVDGEFRELILGLKEHYEDPTLMIITEKVGEEIRQESQEAQKIAHVVLDDIQQSFPEITRAVVTHRASSSIIEDMRQCSVELYQLGEIEDKELEHIEKALLKSRKRLLFHPPQVKLRSDLEILRDIPALHRLSYEALHILHQKSKEHVLNKDQVLYHRGDRSSHSQGFYIITRGSVQIRSQRGARPPTNSTLNPSGSSRLSGDFLSSKFNVSKFNTSSKNHPRPVPLVILENETTVVDRLGNGSVLGALGFMTGTPRHATIICDSYVQAFFVDTATYQAVKHQDPAGFANMELELWKIAAALVAVQYVSKYQHQSPTVIRQMLTQARVIRPSPGVASVLSGQAFLVMRGKCLKLNGVALDEAPERRNAGCSGSSPSTSDDESKKLSKSKSNASLIHRSSRTKTLKKKHSRDHHHPLTTSEELDSDRSGRFELLKSPGARAEFSADTIIVEILMEDTFMGDAHNQMLNAIRSSKRKTMKNCPLTQVVTAGTNTGMTKNKLPPPRNGSGSTSLPRLSFPTRSRRQSFSEVESILLSGSSVHFRDVL